MIVFGLSSPSFADEHPKAGQTELKSNSLEIEKNLNQVPPENEINEFTFKPVGLESAELAIKLPKQYGDVLLKQLNNKLIVMVDNTTLNKKWQYLMNITDTNDLVSNIEGKVTANKTEFILHLKQVVKATRQIEDQTLRVYLSPLDSTELAENNLLFSHNEQISLNLQDINIRAALQVLADFASFNLVTSDDVSGSISLQLESVPWQEVLDIILIAKNLGKRKIGNTLYIAPAQVIAVQEAEALKALNATEATETLKTEFFHLNYADVKELYEVLNSEGKDIVSIRGKMSVDPRTNTLIVEDIQSHIDKIALLIAKLDVPTRQVVIEARIVQISKDMLDELGINYSGSANININGRGGTISGTANPAYITPTVPAAAGSSVLDLSFARLPGSISLDLELLALESEGEAKQVSNPHLIVSDNEEAYITQGQEVPYLESTSSGAAALTFKEAVLELRVTPQIAPNDYLVMDIIVKKDQKSETDVVAGDVPVINKREIKTRLLMKNEETIVLGGIYEKDIIRKESKVPLLGDIPLLGWLFKSRMDKVVNRELLIFLTPKIVR
ncbi:type IV pilus secretin PilQ [Thiotrichales bacterium 19S9-12]|nr:type IV pilus secretin PilQ [Thiotrichales bacterium 19S9-11]MCF6811236.1 type IV pilus secretin PilQ [Thiotrichales bacterium 19S9-12]